MTETAGNSMLPSATYALRQRLPKNRLGDALFSVGLSVRVPYFGTILPFVQVMEPGYARVSSPLWFGVHNHIRTFHAIAACNLAETAMGVLMEASVPRSHRWIPKGMTSEYLAKATSKLTAHARFADDINIAAITTGTDVPVSIQILNTAGVEVVHCTITTWVTPA